MGLDITFYRALGKPTPCTDESGECGHEDLWVNSDFPAQSDGLKTGHYEAAEDSGRFRAGSYSGYNAWREQLAQLAGYEATEYARFGTTEPLHAATVWNGATGPFAELINFSDCEGVIGPTTSAKLAKDFAEFDEKARATFDKYNYDKYRKWQKAFESASQNGAVVFH